MSETLIFNIERGSLHDGPGIRTVVFIKGCTLRCRWCHNPEGISQKPQILRYTSRCIGCGRCSAVCPNGAVTCGGTVFDRVRCTGCGRCAIVCPSEAILLSGELMTVHEVFAAVMRDKRYFKPDGGITLSGGECLTRPEFCTELLRLCRDADIHTAIESALYVPWEAVSAVLPFTCLFIADMKIAESERHRELTGASNERIKDNMRQLFEYARINGSPGIWIRIPVIPGATDDIDNINAIKAFLEPWHDVIEKTEQLEYNSLGEAKKAALIN